ncbi:PAXIP1-associated glutamate-rich protein 1 [Bombyx mandarina]|uniref:PAXIP1-associated protein 1 n=2 Tax=Bombyx TaxID=7090 RepID=A0A8R2ANU4_BOMMO|nr:PAXIP1-associated glutamate-rich protein 1 [Bombyx mori]XP_028029702.1 PAXIP1-associated glutamate-rich protein 1 [Bombyx mandarina]
METEIQGDDWDIPCSDDELAKNGVFIGKSWMPEPAELEELYKNIDKKGILNLEWKCPGRRQPSPVPVSKENQPELPQSPIREEKSDFDFMDEVSSLRLRVRREGEDTLRGSAKKKTTSFDGILSNMIRHKRIEQMEKQAKTSPSTTSSN